MAQEPSGILRTILNHPNNLPDKPLLQVLGVQLLGVQSQGEEGSSNTNDAIDAANLSLLAEIKLLSSPPHAFFDITVAISEMTSEMVFAGDTKELRKETSDRFKQTVTSTSFPDDNEAKPNLSSDSNTFDNCVKHAPATDEADKITILIPSHTFLLRIRSKYFAQMLEFHKDNPLKQATVEVPTGYAAHVETLIKSFYN